jgi:hypothetical protein
MVGIEPLAERYARECVAANGAADEELLTLADFLIVLREVEYHPADGALSKSDFDKLFRPFVAELAGKLAQSLGAQPVKWSPDVVDFWTRVVARCRE